MKLREIHYVLYKNLPHQMLLFTCLAESLYYKYAVINNKKLKLVKNANLNTFEKQILTKIIFNGESSFHVSDYFKWLEYLKEDCLKRQLIKKGFLYIKRTKLFKNEIKQAKELYFNKDIIDYIDTNDNNKLANINSEILEFKIPNLDNMNKSNSLKNYMAMQEVIHKGYFIGASNFKFPS